MQKARRTTLHKRQSGLVPGAPPPDEPVNTSTTTPRLTGSSTLASSTSATSASSSAVLSASSTSLSSSTALSSARSSSTSASLDTDTSIIATSNTNTRTTPTTTPTRAATSVGIVTRSPISRIPTGTPTSSPSISPTPTETAAEGAPVGTIIGVIAAGLIGVIALAAVAGWFFRRAYRKKQQFNRGNFIRQSTAIPDSVDFSHEKVPMGSKNALNLARANTLHDREINPRGPRPPTLIERHVNQAAPGTMPSFQPGQVMSPAQDPYHQGPQVAGYQYGAYGQPAPYPAGGYDYNQPQDPYYNYNNYAASAYTPPSEHQQTELTRRPSGPGSAYLQRQRSNGASLQTQPNPAVPPTIEFSSGRHESVTPYQQQQYAEISRQLNDPGFIKPTSTESAGTAASSTAPTASEKGSEKAAVGRSLSTSYSSLNPNKPPTQTGNPDLNRSGTPTDPNPQQNYYQPSSAGQGLKAPQQQGPTSKRESVFDADDAYGGI